jgi:hypothetical protein
MVPSTSSCTVHYGTGRLLTLPCRRWLGSLLDTTGLVMSYAALDDSPKRPFHAVLKMPAGRFTLTNFRAAIDAGYKAESGFRKAARGRGE